VGIVLTDAVAVLTLQVADDEGRENRQHYEREEGPMNRESFLTDPNGTGRGRSARMFGIVSFRLIAAIACVISSMPC